MVENKENDFGKNHMPIASTKAPEDTDPRGEVLQKPNPQVRPEPGTPVDPQDQKGYHTIGGL